ncbi:MAG: hypothetical protein GC151_05095 [Betaproteobacteria bacterium]|nr:hypothetical protein [Betaproteobacteria bacterium]
METTLLRVDHKNHHGERTIPVTGTAAIRAPSTPPPDAGVDGLLRTAVHGTSGSVMTLALVVNTTSVEPAVAKDLIALVREYAPSAQIVETQQVGEFRRFVSNVTAKGIRRVVVAGGDGSMRMAANALAGTGVEIGLLPFGTSNDFARSVALPTDPQAAVRVALGSATVSIDVGMIQCRDEGFRAIKRRFSNVAEAGPGCDESVSPGVRGHSLAQWISRRARSVFRVRKSRLARIRLWIDGQDLGIAPTAKLIIGNGRYALGDLGPLPQARLNDGFLDVIRVHDVGLIESLRHDAGVHRLPLDHPGIDRWQARRIEVTSDDPVPIAADGEAIGWLPASFEVEPASLRLVVPEVVLPRAA